MAWVEKHGSGFRVRYRLPDGELTSETGFATRDAASERALDIEAEQRVGVFTDPRLGQTLVREWVARWTEAHDVGRGTWAKYDSHLRNHILPRFGEMGLGEITRMMVKAWAKSLRRTLAPATVVDVVSLLSMVLGEAVEENLIGSNPCRRLRLVGAEFVKRPHASPEQVLALAARMSAIDGLMTVTGAYTGMRWGELAGLNWTRVDLQKKLIRIDPKVGALHEVGGLLSLGPPKTPAAVREVHLPDFLALLLTLLHEQRTGTTVFPAADGGFHRRSNFRRRVWLPAVAGDISRGWDPIAPGLHFHDLRHTHKTWMIEDDVPEIAQCERLGHKLAGVAGIYSHVTATMIRRLVDGLQRRWEHTGSTFIPDHYHPDSVVKIGCSHIAPRNAERPADEDHRQAV